MRTIWGLDLGVASVGFAVVKWDECTDSGGNGEIVRLGVRIYPESRESDGHEPKNAARRQKRLIRRQTRRKRWRRLTLRQTLADAGLIPSADARPPAGQDPYVLRARGLVSPLAPEELGWAIFHLIRHRGWQGSRKTPEQGLGQATRKSEPSNKEVAEAEEKSAWLKARVTPETRLATVLATIETTLDNPERRRDRGQTRAMVVDEFDAIWQTQRPHHPTILTEVLRVRLHHAAFFQRPSYFRSRSIGTCTLEPREPRALKADWLAQQFGMLQLVNGLRLAEGNRRALDAAERAKAIAFLEAEPKPTWAALRKAVFGTEARARRFTHEEGKKETVRGNATEACLRTALGPEFPNHPHANAIRHAIGEAWHRLEYAPARGGSIYEIRDAQGIATARAALAARAVAEWNLPADQANRLAAIDLIDGTAMHSRKAIARLLPHLEAGLPYMTAQLAEYTSREAGAPLDRLPGPNRSELTRIADPAARACMEALLAGLTNPSVLRTLNELQKVANTLLAIYGKPDLIRIELARELRQSAEQRRASDTEQRARERSRKDASEKIAARGKPVSADTIRRYLLHAEQSGISPFSGRQICLTDALDGNVTELEHIYPRSRRPSDNGLANQVLCFRGENRDKAGRTPKEWLANNSNNWAYLTTTLWPQMVRNGWPANKRDRFIRDLNDDPESVEFSERQLRDTSYIATTARDYLGLLYGGGQEGANRVQPVAGRATARLRARWGLSLDRLLHGVIDGTAPKPRDDHRHHAIDALVVALAVPAWIKRLSDWYRQRELTATRPPSIGEPWRGLHADARRAVEAIVISHKVRAKLSGPLHEDARLRDTEKNDDDGKRLFAKRKDLRSLTSGEIVGDKQAKIRDPEVARVIRATLQERGIADPRTADRRRLAAAMAEPFRLPRKDGSPGPHIRRVRLLLRKDTGALARVHKTRNSWAEFGAGSNHHLAIYRDGENIFAKAVRIQEAAARMRRREPVVASADGRARLVMALHPGDALRRPIAGTDQHEYRIIRKFNANLRIFYKSPTEALEPKPEVSWSPETLLAEGWRKVAIDPIGRVSRAK